MAVLNKRTGAHEGVYVGRPGPWGNPFTMHGEHERELVVARFEEWFRRSDDPRARWMRAHVHELHGEHLICWCAPKLCHAHVLERWAEVKFHERRPRLAH